MAILWFLLFGLIVGIVAKWFVPGTAPGGIIGDIIVGIIGAFIGSWLFDWIGHVEYAAWTWGGFISAVIGAIVLLFIIRAVSGRRSVV
ncbi:MAG TPA: GlsB/YeaQ/YmgE family stress response membrane protein [Candidatus Baltobacteraceae bacterium]